ncbi:PilN domain-containing protein [Persephonella atlantica]|uniref:PilN domain-containing protein n=1 Tax=Persephonella atlantica TaxID=2699429 RepID=A0ABS1GH59_9AQUI|nr:PilN domain-containing protein [Persephonella atlantica]MBK3332151.1 PilN domain-containing protein [Persephonella atlantica]
MIKINLNPEKRKRKELKRAGVPTVKLKNKAVLYLGIPLILIGAEIVYSVYLGTRINNLIEKKQQLIEERAKYRDVERRINQLKKAVAEAERLKEITKLKIAVFNKLSSEKVDFIPMIKAIAVSIPDGVWLKKVDILRSGGNLTGFSFNPKFISNFYDNLSAYYQTITFDSVERKGSSAKKRNSVNYYSFKFNLSGWKKEKKGGEGIEYRSP